MCGVAFLDTSAESFSEFQRLFPYDFVFHLKIGDLDFGLFVE